MPKTPIDRFPQLIRRKFKPAEVERISGASPESVRQWKHRKLIDYDQLLDIDAAKIDPDPAVQPLMPHGLNTANWAWLSQLAVITHLRSIGIEISLAARFAKTLKRWGAFDCDWTNEDEQPHDIFVMVQCEADWDKPNYCSALDLQSNDPPRGARLLLNLADIQRQMYARLAEILDAE